MNKHIGVVFFVFLTVGIIALILHYVQIFPLLKDSPSDYVHLPPGYSITTFADDLGGSPVSYPGPNKGARMLVMKDDVYYVSVPGEGIVYALPDKNEDWAPDTKVAFVSGLNNPHGLAFSGDWLYIAAEDQIVKAHDTDGDFIADNVTKVMDLPLGDHWTRSILIDGDALYISVGSDCNACQEQDQRRGAITKCNLDGYNCYLYARGLRNAVDMIYHGDTMWVTDNGRDLLGDDLPPDEVNIIEEGKDYGWPICYGQNIHDTDYDKNVYTKDPCMDKTPPWIDLPAHSASLGLTFYEDDLFVAYHGSWNRNPPTGYKIVRINMATKEISDFATGWLRGSKLYGRPVDVLAVRNSLFVTDDVAGKIYRIYKG